jgi:putative transposase
VIDPDKHDDVHDPFDTEQCFGLLAAPMTTRRAESINGLYKTELIRPRRPWRTIEEVELATAEWVHWFNHRRPYEYCGIPPVELETAYYAQHRGAAAG